MKNEEEQRQKGEGGWDEKTDRKKENGYAEEWEQLCGSKWLRLIRHETLHTEAREADGIHKPLMTPNFLNQAATHTFNHL